MYENGVQIMVDNVSPGNVYALSGRHCGLHFSLKYRSSIDMIGCLHMFSPIFPDPHGIPISVDRALFSETFGVYSTSPSGNLRARKSAKESPLFENPSRGGGGLCVFSYNCKSSEIFC